MVKLEASEPDLHFSAGDNDLKKEHMDVPAPENDGLAENPTGFEAMDEDNQVGELGAINAKDLWLNDDDDDNNNRNQGSLIDDASIFYNDFPPLPDFPCMSSSSSSPATPAASLPQTATSSSSSAGSSSSSVSWTMMNSESTPQQFENGGAAAAAALSSTASMEIPPQPNQDCIEDVMENLQYIDLIDCNEMWDPSSIFQTENPQEFMEDQHAAAAAAPSPPPTAAEFQTPSPGESEDGFASFLEGSSELSAMFFEWLKQNRHHISAEDMRSIKLKRSTIENASNRLGTSKEGKKQLLKLILEWVEQHQLQKRRQNPNPNPNFIYNPMSTPDPNTACYSPASPWMATPRTPIYNPMSGYIADPYSNPYSSPMTHQVMNGIAYPGMEHVQSWTMMPMVQPQPQMQFNRFLENVNVLNHQPAVYRSPYKMYDSIGEKLVRLGPSATKEARKKRMARQRKLNSRHNSNSNQHNRSRMSDVPRGGEDGNGSAGGGSDSPKDGDVAAEDGLIHKRQAAFDRRQEQVWKAEKNLKFLLQKVLKQSDVGNLGRIVLPKKEAESHLPELETRDGITIPMEDIGTSCVWNMRYRFWPNNKSRMYLLENTGDFVRQNGLQEGDFIVLYSDTKSGKYMIRGIKVRDPDAKTETKKPTKQNVRNLSLAGNSSSFTPAKKAAR
ncbi:B3 domain-containing transcription factor [Castilleja foliolosa]|uniref:B3 domain-containing transcription factor n=1 Tax=Castilleja foliolosa TaxID=1961234 RepID=A0ABD3DW25_9LAMI